MEDNYIIITIGNNDYYIEASRLNDLNYINNKLVNTSNTSITLVSDYDYNNTQNTYPRITCSAMSQCALRQTYNSTQVAVTNNYVLKNKFNMNTLGISNQNNILIALLTIILGLKLLWKK